MEFPGIRIFQMSRVMGLYGYPIAGYGDVYMPDDSGKAWGMLFESEAWPPPFRVKQNIDILFDSKGSGADSAAPSKLGAARSASATPACFGDCLTPR